ncbi:MAG: hypothetical protein EZS28_008541 [Streblomastix strix]|uniref:Uncharacterized protein n=2 Tax=Streblomastix strix TaxID=222440 RepID=A0A5J4WMR2_9EUKA|nr:MAG: hypothetical protein EZS28_008541 [Streblomastix strix]
MKASNSGQKTTGIRTSNYNKSTVESKEFAMEDFIQNNKLIFRESIDIVKQGSFTSEKTEGDMLRQILRLLVIPVKNEWIQVVQHLAAELQLGNLMLSRLESAQTDETKAHYIFQKNIFQLTQFISFVHILPFAQTYCVSILAVLGLLHVVVDRAREAKREGKEYGGSFMIFGDAELEQEDNEIKLRRQVEIISQYKQSLESIEKDDLQRIEIENQSFKEGKNKKQTQITELKQEILNQEKQQDKEKQQNKEIIINENEQVLNDQELNEKLRVLREKVNLQDNLVDQKRLEVDSLEHKARTDNRDVYHLREIAHKSPQISSASNSDDMKQNHQQEDEEAKLSDKAGKEKDKKEKDKKEKDRKKQKDPKKEQKQEKEKQLKKEQEKEAQVVKEQKVQQQDANTPSIRTEIQIADFRGVVSRILAVLKTKQDGGIAVVSSSVNVPKELSKNDMIKLKGIVFVIPEFALYMNGILLWKRKISESGIAQTPSSIPRQPSSTSSNQLPVWTHLCLQLDMERDERTAKFFLGADLNEEMEIGISKLPPDIQVVVLATGALKAYKAHNTERKGQGITKLVQWVP